MSDHCIFCRIVAGEAPASIVAETSKALAFMDINQPMDGHVLIVPKLHVENIYGLDEATANAVFRLTVTIAKAVKAGLRCDGINLWQSNEPAAQQEVFHLHMHVIARYQGDRDRIRMGWTPVLPSQAELGRLAEAIRREMH